MLIRRLYITKISQPWFSLRYVDPKVVPHKNQSTMVFIQISWLEGYTSPKSVKHCVHWDMLTRRLYLTKISQPWFSFRYLDPKAVHHQKSVKHVFIGICWPEGCTSPKSVKHCVYWDILTRRLYITNNQSNIVFIGICWPEGCTSSKSAQHCVHLGYVDPKVVHHQNQSNIVFIGIC